MLWFRDCCCSSCIWACACDPTGRPPDPAEFGDGAIGTGWLSDFGVVEGNIQGETYHQEVLTEPEH